jgi:hypothetical protein
MQVHNLSQSTQNEFIDLCGLLVRDFILTEIKNAKYFSVIVDGTPDCSNKQQTTIVIRYVKFNSSEFSIEERFLCLDNFTNKTGSEIAARILTLLDKLGLEFKNCIGQGYDIGANMAGKYKGVQAILLQTNPSCIFSSCGNHTLNLVGVDCAESCNEAVKYFGLIQRMYNLFSSSPQRWEILKRVLKKIKNYIRSIMGHDRLNGLAILNIKHDIARNLDFSFIISAFSQNKATKANNK